ncbi:uncharacterized protein LOC111390879 [Olea europaea var. sylvestris]|uniref:uncharacterized protein LOC111390879 n=1 Tax=Olea europaea var. sylvestris TaxID=158386 RepID=UPI000C1D86EA|nr:uncharacterized protein LOC111390879 [Olea europaea var. sylvestris]
MCNVDEVLYAITGKCIAEMVPAFVKHIFAAGMSSSQRTESSHSFLKRVKQILQLPTQYILQRWTKSAKIGKVWDKDNEELNEIPNQLLMLRHSKLSQFLLLWLMMHLSPRKELTSW